MQGQSKQLLGEGICNISLMLSQTKEAHPPFGARHCGVNIPEKWCSEVRSDL